MLVVASLIYITLDGKQGQVSASVGQGPQFPPESGSRPQNGSRLKKNVAHYGGGRLGRAAPRRVANKHLEDALMLAITSYTSHYEKSTKNETGGPVYGCVTDG